MHEAKYISTREVEICFRTENGKIKKKIYDIKKQVFYDPEEDPPKVTGIGGIFFKAKDTKQIKQWYSDNLGLEVNEYGSVFEFRNANDPQAINYLQWSPFNEQTDYFAPSEKEFMINYRVQSIEAMVKKLKENGVRVLDEIEELEYGKFVHILDVEGNKVELWEPADSILTDKGSKTTK
jgi:predicted enzyme related to lactoylglutathione lyase